MGRYVAECRAIATVGFLANPAARKGTGEAVADVARSRLAERGIDVVPFEAADPEAALEQARAAVADARLDALVVCGGDGLINLALQAHAQSDMPLGIVPAGTGNDLARTFGVPSETRAAIDVIAAGWCAAMDLGRITPIATGKTNAMAPRWFCTIACSGFDSLVTERVNQIAWPSGPARYVLATALELSRFRPLRARIVLDGERVIDEPVLMCTMGNTVTYGGGIRICPGADHRDGLFEVTLMRHVSRLRAVTNFWRARRGRLVGVEGVSLERARRIELDMPGVTLCADGEAIAPSRAVVELVPAVGLFLVPEAEAQAAKAR